jgi:hypothetical protein
MRIQVGPLTIAGNFHRSPVSLYLEEGWVLPPVAGAQKHFIESASGRALSASRLNEGNGKSCSTF